MISPEPVADTPCSDHRQSRNTSSGQLMRDIIIGLSDGLTVPFALAAGLSASKVSSRIVVTAGLAEIAAGSIAMGLGGYLAAKSDNEFYYREERRQKELIEGAPDKEASQVARILDNYGLEPKDYWPVIDALKNRPNDWLEFIMRFELGLEKPDPRRALQSAFTIAMSYIVGGIVPLSPYIAISPVRVALYFSIGVTIVALAIFGYVKGHCSESNPFKSALQTVAVGALACAAAFGIASLIELHRH